MPVHQQPTAVQLRLAYFLLRVVRAGGAWSVVYQGEPSVIHAPKEDILPLGLRRAPRARLSGAAGRSS